VSKNDLVSRQLYDKRFIILFGHFLNNIDFLMIKACKHKIRFVMQQLENPPLRGSTDAAHDGMILREGFL
jgi:hypothetical protein